MNQEQLIEAVSRESARLLAMMSAEIIKVDAQEGGSASTSVCINVGMQLLVTAISSQSEQAARIEMLYHVIDALGVNLKAAFVEVDANQIIRRAMKKD